MPPPATPERLAPERNDGDAALAARIAVHDQAAFALLMRRHNQLLFRTARSILRDDNEAQDVLQEAYLHAWRTPHRPSHGRPVRRRD